MSSEAIDVVIWEADGTVDGHRGYGHGIAARLRRAGWRVSTVPLVERSPTSREAAAPAHVLSGGSTAVGAADTWLAAARELLASTLDRAVAGRASVTGVCFGAQLIAHVLAGREAVTPHPGGMQAGLFEVDDPARALRSAVASFHHHRIDRTTLEQAGGRLVMGTATTPVQAFSVGPTVHGVQFHPEMTAPVLAGVLRHHAAVVERCGAALEDALASIHRHRRRLDHTHWRTFVEEPIERIHAATPMLAA